MAARGRNSMNESLSLRNDRVIESTVPALHEFVHHNWFAVLTGFD
jgi:hypothetical protein